MDLLFLLQTPTMADTSFPVEGLSIITGIMEAGLAVLFSSLGVLFGYRFVRRLGDRLSTSVK